MPGNYHIYSLIMERKKDLLFEQARLGVHSLSRRVEVETFEADYQRFVDDYPQTLSPEQFPDAPIKLRFLHYCYDKNLLHPKFPYPSQ